MSFDRRRFINTLLGGGLVGWLASVLYPVLSYLRPPAAPEANVQAINAGLATDFAANAAQIVKFGRKPVIVIKTEEGEFRAFAATCTHLDCIVQYRPDLKQIHCACHNGLYDLAGRNVSGPPPRPLEEFTVNLVDKEVVISRAQRTA